MPPSGYAVPAPPPGGKPARPSTVTAASALLYLLALICIVHAIVAIASSTNIDAETVKNIYVEEGMPQDQAEAAASLSGLSIYLNAGLFVLFGVLFLILGIFVGRGKQWARITTWIVAGLAGLCCFGLGGLLAGLLTGVDTGQAGVDSAAISRRLAELTPDWVGTVSTIINVAGLLASIAVIVLLLLPPSHPFFAKAEPQWTPPAYPAP